jgi:hypothetical protein
MVSEAEFRLVWSGKILHVGINYKAQKFLRILRSYRRVGHLNCFR